MRKIDKIIIHCSATPEGRDVKAETIKGWHVNDNGWSDIGYHYVIELDGTIVNGRPEERAGAHAKGHNKNSIGICYVGGCDKDMNPKDTRTIEQLVSLLALIDRIKLDYPEAEIIGHRDVSNKSCPSFDAKREYAF